MIKFYDLKLIKIQILCVGIGQLLLSQAKSGLNTKL